MYEENVYKNLPLCTELFQSAKHRMPLNKIFAIILCVFVHMEKQVGACASALCCPVSTAPPPLPLPVTFIQTPSGRHYCPHPVVRH